MLRLSIREKSKMIKSPHHHFHSIISSMSFFVNLCDIMHNIKSDYHGQKGSNWIWGSKAWKTKWKEENYSRNLLLILNFMVSSWSDHSDPLSIRWKRQSNKSPGRIHDWPAKYYGDDGFSMCLYEPQHPSLDSISSRFLHQSVVISANLRPKS